MLESTRLSIHQATLIQCSTPQFIDALVRNDVGCTSLWRDKTREYGVKNTARMIVDNGIKLSGYCAAGVVTSSDTDEVAKAIDDVHRALDEAAELGAPCLMFVAGGIDPHEKDIAAARKRAINNISALIPYARSVGVKLALEPLHPMVCATRSVLSTLELANHWCDELDADDIVGIAIDTYAVHWDPEIESSIVRAGKRICSFHVNDWLLDTQDLRLDRGMMGDGVIDIPALRRMVENAGYNGYVEVEIFSQRNWWKRDADEVIHIIKERVQEVV